MSRNIARDVGPVARIVLRPKVNTDPLIRSEFPPPVNHIESPATRRTYDGDACRADVNGEGKNTSKTLLCTSSTSCTPSTLDTSVAVTGESDRRSSQDDRGHDSGKARLPL